MTEFAARISRVRMKDGADVHILPSKDASNEGVRGPLMKQARQICNDPDLDGFVLIGLYRDGASSAGSRLPDRLPMTLVPAYLADIFRRNALMRREAEDVFDDKFQWVE